MITASKLLSSTHPLFSSISALISGELDFSQQALKAYSTDGSPYKIRPQAVIYPKNSTDLKEVLLFTKKHDIPVTVRGNGTSRSGGSLGEGIILDMTKYFNNIHQINMINNTITVDSGVSIKTLREKLHGWNMDIPILTSQDNDGTLGGLVSTKSSTPTSFSHGTIREWVESLTVVLDNGEEHHIADGITPSGRLLEIYNSIFPILSENAAILRANKPGEHDDATGYCLWSTSIGPRQLIDQIVGSEGTFGIITTVTLRLTTYKKHSVTTYIPIEKTSSINAYVDIARHHKAEHLFIYDETLSKLSDIYHENLIPKFRNSPYVVCVTHFDIDVERLHNKIASFNKAIEKNKIMCVQNEDNKTIERITNKTFIFSLLDSYTKGTKTVNTFADGIIVPIHKYSDAVNEIDKYLLSIGNMYLLTGNVGSGHISVIALFDSKSSSYGEDVNSYAKNIFNIVKKYKGGISSTGGDGIIRTPFLPYIYNENIMSIFNKIKKSWDPNGILNPGKKTHITSNYIHERLALD